MAKLRSYYTGLLPFSDEVKQKIAAGAGWHVSVENPSKSIRRDPHRKKEIILHARSSETAQAALSQILDAFSVIEGVNIWSEDFTAIPENEAERHALNLKSGEFGHTLWASGIWDACKLAAKASRKRRWAYALALYRLSSNIHANWPMDIDPALFPYQHRSRNLKDQVRFCYAIVVANAVVETLGLSLHGEAFKDSKWIPEKRADLERRLGAVGINLSETLLWTLRGGRTRLEAARVIPSRTDAPWVRRHVRDCEVEVVEAIAYVRWLRARTAAHDVMKYANLLSVHDVWNSQQLARRLILDIMT